MPGCFIQSEKAHLKQRVFSCLLNVFRQFTPYEAKDRLFPRRGAAQKGTDHCPQLTFSNERIVAS